ncbi:flippase [Halobacillus sp. BBL2006]|uniref:flippase n=1 Tax=Halobacillus sp. BBL2006 TaxID=1543706 RepID=UPI000541CF0A|nr:flippase [Halobacillus sp. BBL2006]KHE67412.1 hypothetical protein LD39_17655 [Halobacillus sp. BBL2006]
MIDYLLNFKKKIGFSDFFVKVIESFFGRGSFIVFSLLFTFICARLYGPELFGEYTYAFTLVTLLMILAKAGMDEGLIYSLPKDKYKNVSLSFIVNIAISVIIITISWFVIDDIYLKFMLPLIWLVSAEQLFFGIYRSEGKIKEFYYIYGLLSMILRVMMIILFYYIFGKNEYSIAIAIYISFIFSNSIYFWRNKQKFKKVIVDKKFLLYSFPLVIATMMGSLINKIDIVMLGSMSNSFSVGVYQVTAQISKVVQVMLMVFNTVFAPKVAHLYHQGKESELIGLYIKGTRILALLALMVTIPILFFSDPLLSLFGEEFKYGQEALIMKCVGQFVNIAVGGVWLMLSMTGNPKFQMYANTFAFMVNIILNYFLIPKYDINGAAFASMITLVITNVIGYIVVAKSFKARVFKFF